MMMLNWEKYPEDDPEFEVVTLTKDNFSDVMTFLMEEGKAVSGELGAGSLPGPVSMTVNGVHVPEGHRVFKRISDGVVGTLAPVKKGGAVMSEQYMPIQDVEYTTTHAPTLGSRLAALKPGTPVLLIESGKTYEVTVQRFVRDGSPDHAALTVGYGPGRWNTEVSAARILAGQIGLSVPTNAEGATA